MLPEWSKWPTEAEAAAMLGTSAKTISRYAQKGRIEIRKRQRPGKKPENVCNPRDIDKLKPAAHVVTESDSALVPQDVTGALTTTKPQDIVPLPAAIGDLVKTIETVIEAIQTNVKTGEILNEKLVLTLKEASRCGFSKTFLRRAVDNGTLKHFRDGRTIKIARSALDEFVRQEPSIGTSRTTTT